MEENVEKKYGKYRQSWHLFSAGILKDPERSFLSFKNTLNNNNVPKFRKFFLKVEASDDPQNLLLEDKISLFFLAASLTNYYYANESEGEEAGAFRDKMLAFHEIVCLDNILTQRDKARLSSFAGYVGASIKHFLFAAHFYDQAIQFEKVTLGGGDPVDLTTYFLQLSLLYLNRGEKARGQPAPELEADMYHNAIKAAKSSLEIDAKGHRAYVYISKAVQNMIEIDMTEVCLKSVIEKYISYLKEALLSISEDHPLFVSLKERISQMETPTPTSNENPSSYHFWSDLMSTEFSSSTPDTLHDELDQVTKPNNISK